MWAVFAKAAEIANYLKANLSPTRAAKLDEVSAINNKVGLPDPVAGGTDTMFNYLRRLDSKSLSDANNNLFTGVTPRIISSSGGSNLIDGAYRLASATVSNLYSSGAVGSVTYLYAGTSGAGQRVLTSRTATWAGISSVTVWLSNSGSVVHQIAVHNVTTETTLGTATVTVASSTAVSCMVAFSPPLFFTPGDVIDIRVTVVGSGTGVMWGNNTNPQVNTNMITGTSNWSIVTQRTSDDMDGVIVGYVTTAGPGSVVAEVDVSNLNNLKWSTFYHANPNPATTSINITDANNTSLISNATNGTSLENIALAHTRLRISCTLTRIAGQLEPTLALRDVVFCLLSGSRSRGVRVQTGRTLVSGATLSVTISPVNLHTAFVVLPFNHSNTAVSFVHAQLTDSSTLTITPWGMAHTVPWYVIDLGGV